MARILHPSHSSAIRKYPQVLLAFSWVLGLGAGVCVFRYAADPLVSLMRSAPRCRLSIVGLMAVSMLPFLFSAFAVFISRPGLILPMSLFKACSYGYISCGVYAAYGNAGWLVHLLLMFSDSLGLCVLYLFWMRHISGFRRFRPGSFAAYAGMLSLICVADYWAVAPFLREHLF